MKVVYLASTTALGPSSRYRIYQYASHFETAGIELEILPAMPDAWLKAEAHSGPLRTVTRASAGVHGFLRRLGQLQPFPRADVVVIERECFAKLPQVFEQFFLRGGVSYGVELDDAIYLSAGRRKKYPDFLKNAAFVIAGNPTIAKWAQYHQPEVHVVPTTVPVEQYAVKTNYNTVGPVRLGWIGLPANFAYLETLLNTLGPQIDGTSTVLDVVSGRPPNFPTTHTFQPWSLASECQAISQFDIGLMPLPDTPFARGKCGLKILQYMAAGIPVVASNVGVNQDLIQHGENGFLATNAKQWEMAIQSLASDPNLRKRLGQAGRKRVETHFSTKVWGPKLVSLYRQLGEP